MKNIIGAVIIEGHVQGLSNTRSLGEAGIPVFVVDKNKCIAQYSRYCKGFFKSPDFLQDEFVDFLIDLAEKEKIRGWVLIPSNDHAVYTISKHKSRLEQYYKVITPGLDIIEQIYDKLKLIETAGQVGVPVPATQNFITSNDKIIANLHFPVITKGRNGLSFYKALRKKGFLAQDEIELRKQLMQIGEKYEIEKTFTQELIPFNGNNKTISFTAFCIRGEIKAHWTGVKLREHPLKFGTATFTKSILCPECHKQSIPLLRAINYTGVCEIEYLFDPRDKQYKLIEINARTWLWVGLAKACGVDYAKMIYYYVNDIAFTYPEEYLIGRFWINPVSDTIYAIQAIFKGQLTIPSYLRSVFSKSRDNALFAYEDWKPGFAYLLNVFHFIRKR